MKKLLNITRRRRPVFKFDLKMKLSILLLLLTFFSLKANDSYAQRTKISLNLHNIPVGQLIDEIESSTEFQFVYKIEDVDLTRTVSVNADNERIDDILNQVFGNTQTTFNLNDRRIYLVRRRGVPIPDPLKVEMPHPVIQFIINGTIKDQDGNPLPGANVVEKGTTNGVTADFDGNFSIEVSNSNVILVVSYIGFASKEIPVNGQSNLSVTLEESAAGLDEVVVVGYGTQKKTDLTGAVSSIDTEQLENSVSPNIDQRLQGMAAGVLVTTDSNQPGGGISIRIRGNSSISAGTEPLYVIDGVPIESSNEGSIAGYGPSVSPLSMLNPNDIANIEILKDASSTAIYGASGSNGVVLITTKSGRNDGQSRISFNTSTTFNKVAKRLDVLNGKQYMEASNQGVFNDFGYTYHDVLTLGDGSELSDVYTWLGTVEDVEANERFHYTQQEMDTLPSNNWQDQIYKTGVMKQNQLSLEGGDPSLKYFFSLGHTDLEGVIGGSDFERLSLRVNLSKKLGKFTLGETANLTRTESNYIRTEGEQQISGVGSIINAALRYRPVTPVIDDDGEFSLEHEITNPLALTQIITNKAKRLRLFGSVFAQFDFTDNLFAKSTVGYSLSQNQDNFYAPKVGSYIGQLNEGVARLGYGNNRTITFTNMLNYHNDFGKNSMNLTAVHETRETELSSLLNAASGFNNDNLRENDLSSASSIDPPKNSLLNSSIESYLLRVNYNYDQRYLVTLSGRYDGSSRFGANNKWALFPSAAFSWNAQNEKFLQSADWLNQLKFRVSYGEVGNQNIDLYGSLSPLSSDLAIIGGSTVVGFSPNSIANKDLQWERKKQTNIGLDIGVWNGKISGSIELYKDKTDQLLIAKRIPTSSGYSTILSNLGSLENKGLELTLNTINVSNENFSWNTSFNISFPKNKILDMGGDEEYFAGLNTTHIRETQILRVGAPIGFFSGFLRNGIAKTDEDLPYTINGSSSYGSYMYKDISGPEGVPDGIVDTTYDRTVIGNAIPDFHGAMTNTASYKNFSLSFMFQGSYGNDIMNLTKALVTQGGFQQNSLTDVLDAWAPTVVDAITGAIVNQGNPDGEVSILGLAKKPDETNDSYVEDGSYLRLKNVQISYSFPKDIFSTLGVSNLEMYLRGTNLLTITDYSGFDPETNSMGNGSLSIGHDYFGYPQSKAYTIGLNVIF